MVLGLICNNEVALPAIQQLCMSGVKLYVGADTRNGQLTAVLNNTAAQSGFSLRLFNAENFNAELNEWLEEIKPDAVLMMTCPFKIPEQALGQPRLGFINFHYGLLPQYRGANPVFEQLRRRESNGGITVHQADKGIDTGAVIFQQTMPIHPDETFGMHMTRLSYAGAEMAARLVQVIASGAPLPAIPQDEQKAVYYPRPGADDVLIKWDTMQAEDIIALSNACNPWNMGAGTKLNGNMLGLNTAVLQDVTAPADKRPGTILSIDAVNGLRVKTAGNKVLRLDILYVNNSFMPGYRLAMFGVQAGMCFN